MMLRYKPYWLEGVYEPNMCHQRRIDNEKNISYEETPAIVTHLCDGHPTSSPHPKAREEKTHHSNVPLFIIQIVKLCFINFL